MDTSEISLHGPGHVLKGMLGNCPHGHILRIEAQDEPYAL